MHHAPIHFYTIKMFEQYVGILYNDENKEVYHMKKLLSISMSLLLLLTLIGCSKENEPESDSEPLTTSSVYDEETVKAELTTVVEQFDNYDFEPIFERMTPEMQEALVDVGGVEVTWAPIAEQVGALVEIEDIAMQETDGYMVSQALVKYENGEMVVQVTWDEDMKIAGLFFK